MGNSPGGLEWLIPPGSLALAVELAYLAHGDQTDKGGEPYVGHLERVSRYARIISDNDAAEIVGWLHDIVEDTSVTLDDLRAHGFDEEIVAAVDALSRREDESNRAYVLRVARHPLAVIVKRADYLDNMDPRRMAKLEPETALRLLRVMADSQYILGKALIEMGTTTRQGPHHDERRNE